MVLWIRKTFKNMSLKNFSGVVTGDALQELFEIAKTHQFALPAVNVVGTNSINAVMETAKKVNSPVIIQDRKSTRLNSSHVRISYAVFCLKKKKKKKK